MFLALLFHATASAAELVGVYASPDVANSVEYRRVVDHLQGPISGDIRGTELTPIIAEWLSDDEEFTLDVEQIATSRDAVGYALFVSRLEHDVIPVTLLAGGGGYSVRIYVTGIMDFFADRGAFSATNRLESVQTVAITDGWLFPTGALLRARPDESQMTGYYEAALPAPVSDASIESASGGAGDEQAFWKTSISSGVEPSCNFHRLGGTHLHRKRFPRHG